MIGLSAQHRYYMYNGAIDMRKSFDGLSGVVRNILERNPLDGDVYIFLNRSRNIIKLLIWDSTGFALYSKRLERGTFEIPKRISIDTGSKLNWDELVLILEGISLRSVRRRVRYLRKDEQVASAN
jgi:transposase